MSDERAANDNLESLVGEAMGGIAEEEARQSAADKREAQRRAAIAARKRHLAWVLVPLCLVLTALNLAGFGWLATPAAPLPPQDARAAALQLLSDAVDELQLHLRQNGSYPRVPAFIGPQGLDGEDEPFAYELVQPDRYLLSVTVDGETVSFDSRDDPAAAFREVRRDR